MSNEVFHGIKAGLEDAIAYANGDIRESVTHRIEVDVPDVVQIRARFGFSQEAFASAMGISVYTLRGWEQGRRRPQGPSIALLQSFANRPWHSTKSSTHHIHSSCSTGCNVNKKDLRLGTGNKPLCGECAHIGRSSPVKLTGANQRQASR